MSLRDEAITHMAKALYVRRNGGNWRMYRPKAESALDALLDFLGAHTEDFEQTQVIIPSEDIIGLGRGHADAWVRLIVAALRGTTEEGEL